jgi:hypothetical protein
LLGQTANGQAHIDIQQSLNQLCIDRMPGQALSIGQVDDDTINLVSMLFQFMLEDKNLAAPIKTQLARMQIPIVRAAMNDKSFFSRGGHPARKLLNSMATAALGWEEPKNIERDPLYKKIGAIVNQLLEDFESDTVAFDEILNDFTDFVELERRRATLIEQRTLDAEDGKAKSEMARQSVKSLLQEKLAGRDLPPVVMNILQDAWSNVLFLANLKEGEESMAWQQSVNVVDDLLWSVQVKESSGDRKRLLQIIPGLLKSLRSGLTQVAFNPFEMNRMFDELENIHLNQLRQTAAENVAEPTAAIDEPDLVPEDFLVEIEQKPVIEKRAEKRVEKKVEQKIVKKKTTEQKPESELKSLVLDEPVIKEPVDNVLIAPENRPDIDEAGKTLDQMLSRRAGASIDVDESSGRQGLGATDLDENMFSELDDMEDLDGFGEDDALVAKGSSTLDPALIPTLSVLVDIEPAAAVADTEAHQRVDHLSVGSWLEMLQDDGSKLRCRLAAIIRSTGKYIFVNRAGMKVSEHTRDSLAQAVEDEEIVLLEDGLLFDRALESVIGNLREMKSQGGS